jgi:hypothetical protein
MRANDGRTIGFGNNPMADLSDIHQRMFSLRAQGRSGLKKGRRERPFQCSG